MLARLRAPSPRTALTLLTLLGLTLLGAWLYRSGQLSSAQLSALLLGLGCWAAPAYLGAFALSQLINIPAMLFILLAPLVFGVTQGFLIAYLGAIVSASLTFAAVRALRGQRGQQAQGRPALKWAWAQRALDGVAHRPVLCVAALRALMGLSPPLNYALALSPVRCRDHALGTALGMAPFAAFITLVSAQL